jgi:hypothetical protein
VPVVKRRPVHECLCAVRVNSFAVDVKRTGFEYAICTMVECGPAQGSMERSPSKDFLACVRKGRSTCNETNVIVG